MKTWKNSAVALVLREEDRRDSLNGFIETAPKMTSFVFMIDKEENSNVQHLRRVFRSYLRDAEVRMENEFVVKICGVFQSQRFQTQISGHSS